MTIMIRPSYYHIDVKPPAPAPVCKPPVNPPKKKAKQTEAQKGKKQAGKWKDILLAFYKEKTGMSQNAFCKIRGLKYTTFKRHWRDGGLPTLKKREGVCEEEVNHVLAIYFAETTVVSEKAREHAAKFCAYLTEDEQVSIP
eukprot:scaffold117110_cov54-Attheya_sp.AAC.2